jgi:hypothetical protein
MSFDIFLSCFHLGNLAAFPRSIVEKAFSVDADETKSTCWTVNYPDGGSGFDYIDEEVEITNFAVNRPPISPAFWEAMLDILRQTPSVLYWPGDGCVVADAAVIEQLPPDLIESLGTPTVVSTGAEILACIQRA